MGSGAIAKEDAMAFTKDSGERRMGMSDLVKAQERIETKISSIEDAIWGNGIPGMKAELLLIKEQLSRIDRCISLGVKILTPILIAILFLGITAWVESVR